MKPRDPSWRDIRRHHIVPDKRQDMLAKIHEEEMQDRCPRCGGVGRIEVHGHYQCAACGSVIDDCCQGECAT